MNITLEGLLLEDPKIKKISCNEALAFLWGEEIKVYDSRSDGVYGTVSIRAKEQTNLYYEGKKNRKLYVVEADSLEKIRYGEYQLRENKDYAAFGSRKEYKDFFNLMNRKWEEGMIFGQDYIKVRQEIKNSVPTEFFENIWRLYSVIKNSTPFEEHIKELKKSADNPIYDLMYSYLREVRSAISLKISPLLQFFL